jgi:hypothetical protein
MPIESYPAYPDRPNDNFGWEEDEQPEPIEYLRPAKIQKIMDEMMHVLAEVVEGGPELDPHLLKQKRQFVQQCLHILGITSFDHIGLLHVYRKVEYFQAPRTLLPPAYPTKQEFYERFVQTVATMGTEKLPPVPEDVSASDVAQFTRTDWTKVENVNKLPLVKYLYDLGQIMSNHAAYEVMFTEEDPVSISNTWVVQPGSEYRSFALRCLGWQYVNESGMNAWVPVKTVDTPQEE